ncbi:RNA pseudouridine synthase [Pelagicoccus sp. NFK12]|uniref:RNA pseudouridine synthase n=1 Tax=Pelagicoccus enzymogenes TaxID=2773457 RepID=A0A927FB69_9BACT|nr:pseudouridine synthase [Pelagicoccus enzymogenes]MBD5780576.1 RNA pseudouridine synthase [Pelagicoccus enzymogenes]
MGYPATAKRLPWARGVKLLDCDANGLLAVEKPAGVLSHPNKKGDREKALLNARYDESQQAYRILDTEGEVVSTVYLLNRLDSATSGIVLLSLVEDTARSVLKAFEEKKVKKTYQALVFGAPRGGPLVWKDRISVRKAQGGLRASTGGGLSAETKLAKVEPMGGMPPIARLTLQPITGRTHQLRIQTSKRHVPIVGDRTYGDFQKNKLAAKKGMKRLCLHCVGTELEYRLGNRAFRFKVASKAPF